MSTVGEAFGRERCESRSPGYKFDEGPRRCRGDKGHVGKHWARTSDGRYVDPAFDYPIHWDDPAEATGEKRPTEMLAEFHAAIEHPETDALWLRRTLHDEEHAELVEAIESGNRAQIARELADVVYVAYGTAHAAGIDLDAALAEVHRANMHKAVAGLRREDGKVVKPPDFVPPDMAAALGETKA